MRFFTLTMLLFLTSGYGNELYQAKCLSCHGENAHGAIEKRAPRLAGLNDWYLASTLKEMKSGARPATNRSVYQSLSEPEIQELAQYLSQLQ